ncbi:hypothetical protein C2S52_012277 [Perilla frutescens var. hirtella]|nr:hypothetical protein C2S52_012277 [Perilla frutescens var. hirtella]
MASPHKLPESCLRVVMTHKEHIPRNVEHEVNYFYVVLRTMEFRTCLNLPSPIVDYVRKYDCELNLLVGRHLGWAEVAEYMNLNQGETVELRSCECDPRTFYLAKKLHDELINVKPEEVEFIKPKSEIIDL